MRRYSIIISVKFSSTVAGADLYKILFEVNIQGARFVFEKGYKMTDVSSKFQKLPFTKVHIKSSVLVVDVPQC